MSAKAKPAPVGGHRSMASVVLSVANRDTGTMREAPSSTVFRERKEPKQHDAKAPLHAD